VKSIAAGAVALAVLLIAAAPLPAAETGVERVGRAVDTVWVLVAAFLVFFMQAGFGLVEAGFIRAKNTCNILMKNWLDYCVASIMFFLVGYAFMFGSGNGFIGTSGFAMLGAPEQAVPLWSHWLFQAAFCGAAATIVAGGMAGRMKFGAYLMYTAVVSAVVYPIIGHWIWGGGWLVAEEVGLRFFDFAGSTVVHATGGWIAFVGTVLLGPRIGKYLVKGRERKVNAIPGHNIPLAALGVFILWFGWFGFNPGSTLGVSGEGAADLAALVAMNTNLAAAAGAVSAMVSVWMLFGKPDLSMTMNGALAGLVAITAPCACVAPGAALAIGAVGGVVVTIGVTFLDRIGVDDPVGAVPVHGMNGVWGTVAVGLFGRTMIDGVETGLARDGLFFGGGAAQLGVQLLGVLCVSAFAMGTMGLVFYVIKRTVGLRVSREEELRGLDIGEHGMEAYAGFQIFTTT
jgi:Amt family ammonium transporter